MTETKPIRTWYVDRLIPGVLVLFFLCDVGSRFVPIDFFSFRGWESMVLQPAPTGPFAPSKRYFNPWSYGDLASFAGRSDWRQLRSETFTTDEYGYRNPRVDHADAILIGDSFCVGSGSSDAETLGEQLHSISGRRVYNAAGGTPLHLPDLRATARRLGMTRGVVIYGYMERSDPPVFAALTTPLYRTQVADPHLSPWDRIRLKAHDLSVSRLEIFLRRQLVAVAPPQRSSVVRYHLRNGAPMLFLQRDIDVFYQPRQPSIDGWVELARELKKDGLDLLVLLIPNKYTVYRPLIQEPTAPPRASPLLGRLEEMLHEAQVPVINLSDTFQGRAASELAHGQYLYWQDDTHWNPLGMKIAAEAVAPRLP